MCYRFLSQLASLDGYYHICLLLVDIKKEYEDTAFYSWTIYTPVST